MIYKNIFKNKITVINQNIDNKKILLVYKSFNILYYNIIFVHLQNIQFPDIRKNIELYIELNLYFLT